MIRTIGGSVLLAALISLIVPTLAFAGDVEAGKKIYTMNCANCHGDSGKGDGPLGASMKGTPNEPRDFTTGDFKFDTDEDGKTGTDADLSNIIKNGASKYGGSFLMAALPQLGDDDVANVIAYIRSLKTQ